MQRENEYSRGWVRLEPGQLRALSHQPFLFLHSHFQTDKVSVGENVSNLRSQWNSKAKNTHSSRLQGPGKTQHIKTEEALNTGKGVGF